VGKHASSTCNWKKYGEPSRKDGGRQNEKGVGRDRGRINKKESGNQKMIKEQRDTGFWEKYKE